MADATDATAKSPDVKYWLEQIEASQKWHRVFHERGQKVVKRYADETETPPGVSSDFAAHRMNVLWSNVSTLQPALYAQTPTPQVKRRFRDKDPVGRWGATVLERVEAYELDSYDDDYSYRMAILDYLLPGRGQVWVNYEPKFVGGKLESECCKVRRLHWKDFLTNPARQWDEVWWVAKREYLTKEEAKAQDLDAAKLSFTEKKDDDKEGKADKAIIWEIWNKVSGKIYFVSKNSPQLLRDPKPPGFKLENFWPCPRPLTATTTPDSILPIADFLQYQNQADEIDRLTQRINILTKALRVAGVYDASQEALGKLLDDNNTSNALIPCDSYVSLASQGGVEGSVSFFPLKDVIQALAQCYESRDASKQTMYEITGISDIVRGASNAAETATAQQIKSQWGSLRIRDRQTEVQRFVRDVFRIKAEIHAELYSPETLRSMSNVPLLDQAGKQKLQQKQQISQELQQAAQDNPELAQQALAAKPELAQLAQPLSLDELQKLKEPAWEEVVALLKDQKLRGYHVDVETDSTIQPDETAEKEKRTEFLAAMTSLMQALGPMVMADKRLAPLGGDMMLFGARAFKTADSLETSIEEYVEQLNQQTLLPQEQQPPDPKVQAEQQKQQFEQEKMAHEKEMFAGTSALERDKLTADQQKSEADRQADLQKHAMTTQADVAVAEASRPRFEDSGQLGQIAEIMQQNAEIIAAAVQESVAQSERNARMFEAALAQMVHVVSAPRDIVVKRDKNRQIVGGSSAPLIQGNA